MADESPAGGLRVCVVVPGLRVRSELNTRSHWSERRKRFADQRVMIAAALSQVGTADRDRLRAAPEVRLRLVRVGGRKLDPDNCVSGFKACLDQVCAWLRIDDGDPRLRLEWPGQEPGEVGVRIELSAGG